MQFFARHALKVAIIIWSAILGSVLCYSIRSGVNPFDISAWIGSTGQNDIEEFRNFIWTWSFLIGSYVVLVTIINSLRRTTLIDGDHKIKRDELNSSTFSESVRLLSAPELPARLGAIYALESLMRSSFKDASSIGGSHLLGQQIGETLAAYVRATQKIVGDPEESESSFFDDDPVAIPEDIQAAVSVLVRAWPKKFRPKLEEGRGVDLKHCRLDRLMIARESELDNFDFSYCSLFSSDFSGSSACDIKFRSSILTNSSFESVSFDKCVLIGAVLNDTDFSDAVVRHSSLFGSKLDESFMGNSFFEYCRIESSRFSQAHLDGAVFRNCTLAKSTFFDARLNGTKFISTDTKWPLGLVDISSLSKGNWSETTPPSIEISGQ